MEEEFKEEQEQEQSQEEIKEQTLEQSRKNKHIDERYKKNYDLAYRVGLLVFIVLSLAIAIVEYRLYHQFEFVYGYLATFGGVGGSISLTRGILNREKSSIILGAIEVAAAIAFFVCFVLLLTTVA